MLLTDTNVKRKEVGTLDNLTSMTWFDKAHFHCRVSLQNTLGQSSRFREGGTELSFLPFGLLLCRNLKMLKHSNHRTKQQSVQNVVGFDFGICKTFQELS